ncbi:MAG: hypothetical protein RLZZ165_1724 [Bacteroidota bacterium]|jgi:hypothetical protein
MMTVACMDKSVTTVTENQMVVHFSHEFHDSKWWPLSPFVQEFIPFPKNDIATEVLEVTVDRTRIQNLCVLILEVQRLR